MMILERFKLCATTWRHHSECARVRASRRRIRRKLHATFETLCDTKCEALKETGVFATEHRNLEAAILSVAHALNDYRDVNVIVRPNTLENPGGVP